MDGPFFAAKFSPPFCRRPRERFSNMQISGEEWTQDGYERATRLESGKARPKDRILRAFDKAGGRFFNGFHNSFTNGILTFCAGNGKLSIRLALE